ncbi:SAV_915 family protein [Streptomyces sp. TBY4]|uniref:SAV_915 family protein n=1 Tax=Streptomyces sp. TBY4 TaxID=2962030 RepID=UPI0020B6CF82|nr:SAV_915 family protein [Streptomyces sp. TBY4]MCP3754034.1 hypothetical protein [Streptomyces sp. TBY4]
MCLFRYEDDPEPEERVPAGPRCVPALYVPARPGPASRRVVRLFRTPLGARTAVGFTSARLLAATLGDGQPWIRLSEAALRSMAEPLGASLVTVDPTLTAPAVTPAPAAAPATPAGPVSVAAVPQAPESPARTARRA